jgi:hypothetical protein
MNRVVKTFTSAIILWCFVSTNAFAITYHTTSSGYWSNSNIWLNGVAPSTNTSDSIIISNFIEFTSDLDFLPNAYVRIDSSGALCGHYTITFNSNTLMQCYGILENDTFISSGGQIYFYQGAHIIWNQYGTFNNGASLTSTNAHLEVGPWFQCLSKNSGIDEPESHVSILTGNDRVYSVDLINIQRLYVTDMSGRIVLKNNSGSNTMDLSGFMPGIYIVNVRCNEGIFRQKFFVY